MKDETYWIRWLEEHDTEAMKAEVVDLNHSIYDGAKAGTLSDQQIVTRGRRQAELIHELLEFYGGGHLDDVASLAEEMGFTVDKLMRLNVMHLANRAHPSVN